MRKFLAKRGHWIGADRRKRIGKPATYSANVIEVIRALLGQHHELPDPDHDWFTDYLQRKDGPHAPTP